MNEITFTVLYMHNTDPALDRVQGTYKREMAVMNANLYNAIPDQPCKAHPLGMIKHDDKWYYATLDNLWRWE